MLFRSRLSSITPWQPRIFPDFNVAAITHSPDQAIFQQLNPLQNAAPRIRNIGCWTASRMLPLGKYLVGEVLGFQQAAAQGRRVQQKPPPLSSKHRQVENMEITEAQTTLGLRFRQQLPAKPMMSVFILAIPPVPAHHRAEIIAEGFC